ncbi:vicilin-like seed storage protein At2g18540 isoform X3 [Carica papaya]|uniref:vicilin-like seed storage protein At2g18540 isoform X3 n=1 Tax=Carica papaya TaxID=3649 RepID=UPI000B8D0C51|nr:vicilin-like seed storage protein At2g18540 isoform X3 [Carica papaya]
MGLKLFVLFNVGRERSEYRKEMRKTKIENKIKMAPSIILFLLQFLESEVSNRERKEEQRKKEEEDRKEDRWVSLQDPTLLSHSVKFQSLLFTSLARIEGEKYKHNGERKVGKRQKRADMDLKLSILFNVERERKEYQKAVRKKMIENKLNCPLSTIVFLFQFIGSKEPNRERKEEQRKRDEEDRKKRYVFLFKDPTVAGGSQYSLQRALRYVSNKRGRECVRRRESER